MSKIDNKKNQIKSDDGPLFTPPLFIQRYRKVIELMEKHKGSVSLSKIADIGCSTFGLFPYLKCVKGVREIVFVDIDHSSLKEHLRKLNPIPGDYILKRKKSFEVTVLCADARYYHAPLQNANIILMIEFIEHLIPVDLEHVMNRVFSEIRPKLVIITTPNRDFNQYFPDFTGEFRHYDHKFEFSHDEFVSWCISTITNYPYYDVTFSGCGGPIKGTLCTQIATFLRNIKKKKCRPSKMKTPQHDKRYKDSHSEERPCHKNCFTKSACNVMHEVQYPFDRRTKEECQIDTIKECWGYFCRCLQVALDEFYEKQDIRSDIGNKEEIEGCKISNDNSIISFGKNNEVFSSFVRLKTTKKNRKLSEEKLFIKATNDNRFISNKVKLPENTIYLNERKETFYVSFQTFITWSDLEVDSCFIKKVLLQMNLKKIELDSQLIFVLSFGNEESDDEDNDEDGDNSIKEI